MNNEDVPLPFAGFSALGFAESLDDDQLEYITEFSDQVESLRFISRLASGPKPTLEEALEVIAVAPDVRQLKRRRQMPLDHEWKAELKAEIPPGEAREGERTPAVLTYREIRALLKASSAKKRDYLIIRVFYATAMRIGELENLCVADLYLDELKILVREGKGDKDRYVLMDSKTAKLLAEYTKNFRMVDKVFGIVSRQISRVVKGYAEDLGITARYDAIGRNFSPHSFRHTCATHLYQNGIDLYVLQNLLGHTSLMTTQEYIHVGISRRKADYEAAHPLCQFNEDDEDEET